MIAPRETAGFVHALLDDGPVAVAREDERVQIDLKAVRDCVVVHARGEPAGANQRVAIEVDALGDRPQLAGRVARLLAASTADVDAELVGSRIEASLQRAHDRRGDAGGVPVHAHHRPERLEPERIAQARQQRRPAVMEQHAFRDRGAERGHTRRQPGRHAAAVQREVGDARSLHAVIVHGGSKNRTRPTSVRSQDPPYDCPCARANNDRPTGERTRALAP